MTPQQVPPTAEQLYRRIKADAVTATLKPHGFRRKGDRWSLYRDGNWGIVHIQKSRSSSPASLVFTINLGTAVGRFAGWPASATPPDDAGWHWRERINVSYPEESDHWWIIDRETDYPRLVADVSQALGRAVPIVAEHMRVETLREAWESGRSPGLTETQRARLLAILRQDA